MELLARTRCRSPSRRDPDALTSWCSLPRPLVPNASKIVSSRTSACSRGRGGFHRQLAEQADRRTTIEQRRSNCPRSPHSGADCPCRSSAGFAVFVVMPPSSQKPAFRPPPRSSMPRKPSRLLFTGRCPAMRLGTAVLDLVDARSTTPKSVTETEPTRRRHKRPVPRERAEIFSLQLSPRLNERSRFTDYPAPGADQANPLSGSCGYCTRGPWPMQRLGPQKKRLMLSGNNAEIWGAQTYAKPSGTRG